MSQLSASALARAFGCPGSFALPIAGIENEWAQAGNDEHDELSHEENIPEQFAGHVPVGALSEVKLAYDVATRKGRVIGQGSDRNYGPLAPFEVAGSCDWMGTVDNGRCAVIVDWKTGFNDVEPASRNAQQWFYALATCRALGCSEAIVRIIYTKTGRVDEHHIDELELADFANRLENTFKEVARQKSLPVPDTRENEYWCKHCPSKSICPTKTGLIKSFVKNEGAELVQVGKSPLTKSEAADAYRMLASIDTLVYEAKKRLEKWVEENGPIDLGQGRAYGPFSKRGNEKLDARIVATAIEETCGELAPQIVRDSMEWSVTKAALKRSAGSLDKKIIARARELGGVNAEVRIKVGEYLKEAGE